MNLHDANGNPTGSNNAGEEHIMAAFTDLRRRTGTVPVDNGPHLQPTKGRSPAGLGNGGPGNRLIPALALAVAAAVAGFSAWQLLPGDDPDSINVTADGELRSEATTDGDPDGDTDGENGTTGETSEVGGNGDPDDVSDNGAAISGESGRRYRVDTAKVEADSADPFLNVRVDPDPSAPIIAKLPPTYRGLVTTELPPSVTPEGGTWIAVELIDPVRYDAAEAPLEGGSNPVGWVNSAFTVPLDDGLAVDGDEVAACTSPASEPVALGALSSVGYVYGLESGYIDGGDCLRIVLTVAAGSSPFLWDDIPAGTAPATALPEVFIAESGGGGVVVNLGNVASAWPSATETDDDVYIVRGDDGNVDLVSPIPVGRVHLTALPADGIVVVDLEVAGDPPTTGRFVALTDEPQVTAGTVTVSGLARPFEANLGVSIIDEDGSPTAALFSGSADLGTRRGLEYGVQTNDWTEAWGRFTVTASDLAPGSYTMLLDGEGGVDRPTRTAVPFTIVEGPTAAANEPTAEEQAAAQALVRFAQGGSLADVNLADEVVLSLGLAYDETFVPAQLEDRSNWSFDYEPYAGRVAPFDILAPLIDGQVKFSVGSIPHCASPALDWPTEWEAMTQINIEPVDATSCLDWYGISLFRNNEGAVEVIVLDLFEP